MSLDLVIRSIVKGSDLPNTIDQLGTLLRDESNRSSLQAREIISTLCGLYRDHSFLILRVLINFTAENDENRDELTSEEVEIQNLWHSAISEPSDPDTDSRLMMLITQFIRSVNDAQKERYLKFMKEKNIASWVLEYFNRLKLADPSEFADPSELALPLEFISEYSKIYPQDVSIDPIVNAIVLSTKELDPESEMEEILLHLSAALLNITSIDLSSSVSPVPIAQLIPTIPDSDQCAKIKRNLFAASANISASPNVDLWTYVPQLVALICSSSDPYVSAASAICLGNCVSSRDTQQRLIGEIGDSVEELVSRFLKLPISDAIQLQGFHMLSNIMCTQVATTVLDYNNEALIGRTTKIAVDNFPYYKDACMVYMKFLKKLFMVPETQNRLAHFSMCWTLLVLLDELQEALLQLLQNLAKNQCQEKIVVSLVENLFKISGTIDSAIVLEKLKTLAVFVTSFKYSQLVTIFGTQIEQAYLRVIYEFLDQISQAARIPNLSESESFDVSDLLESDGNGAVDGAVSVPADVPVEPLVAIRNNLKYVAAVVVKQLEASTEYTCGETKSSGILESIHSLCVLIIQSPDR